MNNYEALFIIKPDLQDAEAAQVIKAIGDAFSKNKASLKKEENWGKRQLAYPVKKCREGLYYKVDFESSPETIVKLKETYALHQDILRVMITKR